MTIGNLSDIKDAGGIAEVVVWGHPWHGQVNNGTLHTLLPTPETEVTPTYPPPAYHTLNIYSLRPYIHGADTHKVHPSGVTLVRTPEQIAAAAVTGMKWQDYAVLTGPNKQIYGVEIGYGKWLWCKAHGDIYCAEIGSITVDLEADSAEFTLSLTRFGELADTPITAAVPVSTSMSITPAGLAGLFGHIDTDPTYTDHTVVPINHSEDGSLTILALMSRNDASGTDVFRVSAFLLLTLDPLLPPDLSLARGWAEMASVDEGIDSWVCVEDCVVSGVGTWASHHAYSTHWDSTRTVWAWFDPGTADIKYVDFHVLTHTSIDWAMACEDVGHTGHAPPCSYTTHADMLAEFKVDGDVIASATGSSDTSTTDCAEVDLIYAHTSPDCAIEPAPHDPEYWTTALHNDVTGAAAGVDPVGVIIATNHAVGFVTSTIVDDIDTVILGDIATPWGTDTGTDTITDGYVSVAVSETGEVARVADASAAWV